MAWRTDAKRPAVLFFTISDFGFANVVLATVYELLRQNRVDIHVASFVPLQPRLDALIQQVLSEFSASETPELSIKFHNIAEFPGFATWASRANDRKKADIPHPPGRKGAEKIATLTLRSLAFMEPKEYLSLFDWSSELASTVNPALVVADAILLPVHDMARTLKRKYAILHPWIIADGLIPREPWLAAYWKYPAFGTGFSYPVPWTNLLENIYCYRNAKKCRSHPSVVALNQARHSHGIQGNLGSFTPWVENVPILTPMLKELDLPMTIPNNVHNCGPILTASPPLETTEPDLLEWLTKRPTVLVALGTHFEAYSETVKEQARGLQILMQKCPDVQVLWKLKRAESSEKAGNQSLEDIIGTEVKNDRIRIYSWLKADPVSILASGHVICSVHHGGANSYFEAAWAGVPQVVLSMWYDTFDFATRVEHLGIGIYGNKIIGRNCVMHEDGKSAPNLVDGNEFAAALLKAMGTTQEAGAMRTKAAQLSEICRRKSGRAEAARFLTNLCFE